MNAETVTAQFIDGLNRIGIPWMIVGSFSSSYYGIPRATHDADFVVQLGDRSILEIGARLGTNFRLDPQMSFETVTTTRRYKLTHADSSFVIELFLLGDDPHDQSRFSRRMDVALLGQRVYLPTVEDVLVTKLRWLHLANRQKDELDIRSVIAVQQDKVDWTYVETWCDRHGSRPTLDRIRGDMLRDPAG